MLTLIAFWLGFRERRGISNSFQKSIVLICTLWITAVIVTVVDIQVGGRLYLPTIAFDQSLRTALATSATHSGVPPANPFFYPGRIIHLRYYYYWNVICALPAKLFGLDPRITTLSGIVWSGFALMALIPAFLKFLLGQQQNLMRKSMIGVCLLTVTGADIIPTLIYAIGLKTVYADMEWWDSVQVTSWFDSLVWVPHHVEALVAALVGFLVLFQASGAASKKTWAGAVFLSGMAFASAAGLSVYITLTFAVFLFVWGLLLLPFGRRGDIGLLLLSGMFAILLSLGYLHDLRQPGLSGSLASLHNRTSPGLWAWSQEHLHSQGGRAFFKVLMLPAYYLAELGFFALVGTWRIRRYIVDRKPLQRQDIALLALLFVSLMVASFLQSSTGNNDLGYRSVLFAQFVLLLWSIALIEDWQQLKLKFVFGTFLILGVCGTLWQFADIRLFTPLLQKRVLAQEVSWLPASSDMARDVFLVRQGFEQLNKRLPPNAVTNYNPATQVYVPDLYYGRHQNVAGIGACGTAFGGDPFECMKYHARTLEAFNGRVPLNAAQVDALCKEFGIDVMIAERTDRAWPVRRGWVWTAPAVVANDSFRAIACGPRSSEIRNAFH